MSESKRIYDGNRAKEILENEVFIQVFDDIEKELIEAWKQSPQKAEEDREKLYQYQTMLQKVKGHLVSTFESGKLAEIDVNHKKSLKERLTQIW